MEPPRSLSITEAGRRMGRRELSALELVSSCLERIQQREASVRAWVEIYEAQALAAAGRCDEAAAAGQSLGALHGIPIGVKDIIDVAGMWTRAGCAVYPPRLAASDAPSVARLRAAGAVILGKTETTAFANNDPAPTRNPWNPRHTPGGSSSGSAAAVADRMCLAALGTQTGGSVLRPAAYNGVVGLKPTYAAISLGSVVPVSWTLDHLGPHARTVEDVKLLFDLLKIDAPSPFANMPSVRQKTKNGPRLPVRPPLRLGFFRKFCEKEASPLVAAHLESVCGRFQAHGARIIELDLLKSFTEAGTAHRIIMDTELSCYHREWFGLRPEQYPPNLRTRIEKGLAVPGHKYVDAVRRRIAFQQELSAALKGLDAAILPTAPSPAPAGLISTGSPVFCVPWSLAGFPAVTMPSGLDDQGLPLGVQIGTRPYDEDRLLAVAAWCERLLSFNFSPAG